MRAILEMFLKAGVGNSTDFELQFKAARLAREALEAKAAPVGEPIAFVSGAYGGIFTIEAINRAQVLPPGMALYASQQAREVVAEELFDGHAVLCALSEKAKARTSAENVSDVLDAVVGLIRARLNGKEVGRG